MAHTKGWGASAAIKSDVTGAQVFNVRRVCSLAESRSKMDYFLKKNKVVLGNVFVNEI